MAFFAAKKRSQGDAYLTPPHLVAVVAETAACLAAADPATWHVIDAAAGDGRIGAATVAAMSSPSSQQRVQSLACIDVNGSVPHIAGATLHEADFLAWRRPHAANAGDARCLVVSNPPFRLPGETRHAVAAFVQHAFSEHVRADLVVMVVPLSMRLAKNQARLPLHACRLVHDGLLEPRWTTFAVPASAGRAARTVRLRVGVQAWRRLTPRQLRAQQQRVPRHWPLRAATLAYAPIRVAISTRAPYARARAAGREPHALVRCKGNVGDVGIKWWSRRRDAPAFAAELARMDASRGKGLYNVWIEFETAERSLLEPWFADRMRERAAWMLASTRDVSPGNTASLTPSEFLALLLWRPCGAAAKTAQL